jgi:surface polysaccharide O-acyltransferase-like enzyme
MYLFGVGSVLITILGTYYLSNSKGEEDSRLFSNLSIQAIAISTAVFLVVKELAPKCGKAMLKAVGFVRKDLFGIYLTHALWIPIVDIEAFRHCCSEIITLPLITIVVFMLSLFTTKLIRLVPGLRKVVE